MDHRHLGKSGLVVSAMSYGNWLTHSGLVDDETAVACMHAALDVGISTFDTADVYAQGHAEEVLGQALDGTRRESVEILTKAYWPTGPGANERGLSKKHIFESLHASLRRLRTDYVDVYQAHRFDFDTPLEETLRAFDDLVRQGKALYVGVSEWNVAQIASALEIADDMGFDRIVSNQPQYSLLWRVIEAEVVPLCASEGIGQLVWSPLAQGVLTGKYAPGESPLAGSRATSSNGSGFMKNVMEDNVLERVQAFAGLAREAGLTPAVAALAWVLRNENVSSAILGATRPQQIEENARALDVTLEEDFVGAIEEVLDPVVVRDPSYTKSPTSRP